MKELTRIISVLLKEKRDVVLSVLFGYLAGIAAVSLFAANGFLISQAALEPPLYVLIGMVAVVKIGSIIRATSRYGERLFSHRATFTMLSDLRVYFYERIEKMAPSKIQQFRSGDLLARIVGDVESLQNFFLRVVYPPILMVTVFLTTLLFLSFYSIEVVILLTVGLIVTGFVIPAWFAKKQRALSGGIREERAKFSTEVTEWFQGFRELKIHQQLEKKEEQLIAASDAYVEEHRKSESEVNKNHSINLGASFVILWSVLAVGGYLVASNQLDGIFLAMIVMISLNVFEHSTPMAAFPVYYEESERAASRLQDVVSEDKSDKENTVDLPKGPLSITLDHVHFRFPGELRETIRGVSLDIKAGSKVAIVGASGSGKSTLLKLLLKMYQINEGSFRISGVPIENIQAENIWASTKVILQENQFFSGTIKDNLLAAEEMHDEEVAFLLEKVELSHFSPTDPVLEKGENLSGGEKQRLAMARALVKSGNLWLLDEPTSSLDGWTEQRMYRLLEEHAKSDTVILVSHRLTGLEKMDQIIVMDHGKIIENGSFEELMVANGYFYELKELEKNIVEL
ncbi:thiol reductant ABC exporter subunit CydC [Sutcliffiella cohnii]|uniref:Thiol reductant ABC exporter subunit CydC n=1 Tax=Sutcliffiella cohnii TaxID=33932 RepID=A0A223KPF2_9BACI|nr:thiol reductant ABC exporter subunit CydC [Sutcliffiella cohnii]AST91372.1 thiol reductant ABC exporter subunit CydC [Sutcliffiella cohnii]